MVRSYLSTSALDVMLVWKAAGLEVKADAASTASCCAKGATGLLYFYKSYITNFLHFQSFLCMTNIHSKFLEPRVFSGNFN